MSYHIYTTDFLVGKGYGLVIITDPILSDTSQNPGKSHIATDDHKINQQLSEAPCNKNEVLRSPLSGSEYFIESHAFFSGNLSSYFLMELRFDSEQLSQIGADELHKIAFSHGKEHIYTTLNSVSPIQYQGMLAGYGFTIKNSDKNALLNLHLRNFLDAQLETTIETQTRDINLKSFIGSLKSLRPITSVRKVPL